MVLEETSRRRLRPFGEVFPTMKHRAAALSDLDLDDEVEKKPKRSPQHVKTVPNDKFQVKGEKTIYDDPVAAIRRARERGAGSKVIRLSDGKLIAEVPGYIPPPPKEWP